MAVNIEAKLTKAIATKGDINEHLIYLTKLATQCESILECGVRKIVSSWAFVNGLTKNNSRTKVLTCSDLYKSTGDAELAQACLENKIQHEFIVGNDLDIPMKSYDLIFIDTWHVYGHLKRELAKFHPYALKYIVMHDTTVDEVQGESIRTKQNVSQQVKDSGYSQEEICKGLGPAIQEFLTAHPEWKIKEQFTHNNGLTVLERI